MDNVTLHSMFIGGGAGLLRVLLVGVASYVFLVALLRVSGKRTLAKLNAFDLVITVALGSTLSSIILDKTLPFSEGAAALALLVALQFAVTWCNVRWPGFRRAVTNEPALLVLHGRLLQQAMLRERVAEQELHAAIRAAGMNDMSTVGAIVLETDGTLNVLQTAPPSADEVIAGARTASG